MFDLLKTTMTFGIDFVRSKHEHVHKMLVNTIEYCHEGLIVCHPGRVYFCVEAPFIGVTSDESVDNYFIAG